MQTYLKNGYIVTMGADETVYDGGGVLIEGENIVAVGKIDPQLVKPDAEVLDLQGKCVDLQRIKNTFGITALLVLCAFALTSEYSYNNSENMFEGFELTSGIR